MSAFPQWNNYKCLTLVKGGGGDRQKQQQEKMEQMENMKNGILSQVVYMVNIINQFDYYDGLFIYFEPRESPEVTTVKL